MRRIVLALAATVSGLVMLFSWPTSTNQPVGLGSGAGPAQGTSGATGATAAGTSGTSGGAASTTYTGAAERTAYGDVQVEITVADGQIVDATALSYPHRNGHDQQINAYAVPILEQATVAAQGAGIDLVSGATITSRGYVGSLQDALDQAGL